MEKGVFTEEERIVISNLNPNAVSHADYEISRTLEAKLHDTQGLAWQDCESMAKDLGLYGIWIGNSAVILKLYLWKFQCSPFS